MCATPVMRLTDRRDSLDESGDDPRAFFGGELVHAFKRNVLLDRSRVNKMIFPVREHVRMA